MILTLLGTVANFYETVEFMEKLAIVYGRGNIELTYISIMGDFSCSEFERDTVGFEPIDDVLGRALSKSYFLFPTSVELS